MESPEKSPEKVQFSPLKRKLTEVTVTRGCKVPCVGKEHVSSNGLCTHSCHCPSMQPKLADNCLNYLNSGIPRRILFYSQGHWSDFPVSVRETLIDGFKNDKSCLKVMIGDHSFLIDMMSMAMVNLRTRKQCSIAWIDDDDKCFFPNHFFDSGADEFTESASETRRGRPLEAAIQEGVVPQTEVVKQVVREDGDSVPQRLSNPERMETKVEVVERDSESFLFVQNLFLSGMGPFATPRSIVQIIRYAPQNIPDKIRHEAFERQIRSTRAERGNANVRYAWLCMNVQQIAKILLLGFSMVVKPTEGAAIGSGIYFMPENRAFASVNLCDVDEKGMQHLMLCRVIFGNMEEIKPGSKQNMPSSKEYDSGVDDHSCPKRHVVWSTHVHSYVHPEFIVSFRLAPSIREYFFGLADVRFDIKQTKAAQEFSTLNPISCELDKGPTSPWIPLTVLFKAVQDKISSIARELLYHHYGEMKRKIITREDLIKKIRLIVGDPLLMTTLMRLKRCPSSWQNGSTAQTKCNDPVEPQDGSTAKPKYNDPVEPDSLTLTLGISHSAALNVEHGTSTAPKMSCTEVSTPTVPNDSGAPSVLPKYSAGTKLADNLSSAVKMMPKTIAGLRIEPDEVAAFGKEPIAALSGKVDGSAPLMSVQSNDATT